MRRREFIALLGGAAVAWPLAARAQQPRRLWRVGFLAGASRPVNLESSQYAGFNRGMRELGYSEGDDFIIEWRFAEGRFELFPQLAAELVRSNVDVIVVGTAAAVPALKQATSAIPIVMSYSTDPVGMGFVSSLAHPGGNVTGLSSFAEETTSKQFEILAKIAPRVTQFGFATNPDRQDHIAMLKVAQSAAEKTSRGIVSVQMKRPDDVPIAFATLANNGAGAIL